jgi:SAM-dependent methyltransferase
MPLVDHIVRRSRRARTSSTCAGCGAPIGLSAETFQLGEFRVHRCGACASLAPDPVPTPDQLRQHYAHYVETYTAGMGQQRYEREMPQRFQARLDLIQHYGGRGRLMDLGGANGLFGRLAHARGFRVDIADYVSAPVDLGFTTAVPADLSVPGGAPFPDGTFDVVTLWSCIEHVRDPETCLSELVRIARPGALIAIDTPLVGDLCERLYFPRTVMIGPPEHLFLFSARGLRLAVERAGLDVLFSAPFHERTVARAFARRGRNIAVALRGLLVRVGAPDRWERGRDTEQTAAADCHVLIARKP